MCWTMRSSARLSVMPRVKARSIFSSLTGSRRTRISERLAGAEVVDGKGDPELAYRVDVPQGPGLVVKGPALGDLKHHCRRADDIELAEQRRDERDGLVVAEAAGLDVDRDGDLQAGGAPGGHLLQRNADDITAQQPQVPAAGGRANELVRAQGAVSRMHPTYERLDPSQSADANVDDWLIAQDEFAPHERSHQLGAQRALAPIRTADHAPRGLVLLTAEDAMSCAETWLPPATRSGQLTSRAEAARRWPRARRPGAGGGMGSVAGGLPMVAQPRQLRRRALQAVALLAVVIAGVLLAPGLGEVRRLLSHAHPGWLAAAAVLEVLSCCSYGDPRSGPSSAVRCRARSAWEIAWAELATGAIACRRAAQAGLRWARGSCGRAGMPAQQVAAPVGGVLRAQEPR